MLRKLLLSGVERSRALRAATGVVCALGALLLGTAAPSLAQTGTIEVFVDPATQAVPVNGTFTVDIVADCTDIGADGLAAYEFDVVYDPDYVEVVSVADAGELAVNGRTTVELATEEVEAGRTAFGAYSQYEGTPQPAGPTGTVVLATVELQAKRAGVATLGLENVVLADTQGVGWPDGGAGRSLVIDGGEVWALIDAFSHFADFDGDGKADPALRLPSESRFKWKQSGDSYNVDSTILLPADGIPLTGDYDGDGLADPALYLPGGNRFKWKKSGSGYAVELMAIWPPNAVPLVGDFDGDGTADPATFNPGNQVFRWLRSGDNYSGKIVLVSQGPDAIPLVGDFDGDGKDDPASWDPDTNTVRWKNSGSSYSPGLKVIGPGTGIPLVGDLDGDGKADPAIWDAPNKVFRWKESGNGYAPNQVMIGPSDGVPMVEDFDGDGKSDPSVWEPGRNVVRWKQSTAGYTIDGVTFPAAVSIPID